jgi:hypothetical protein
MLNDFYTACRRLAANILRNTNGDLGRTETRNRAATVVSLLSGAILYTDTWQTDAALPDFREHILKTIECLPYTSNVLASIATG